LNLSCIWQGSQSGDWKVWGQKPLQFSKEEVQKKDVEEAQKQHSMQALTWYKGYEISTSGLIILLG
jgi:hypothetical protein